MKTVKPYILPRPFSGFNIPISVQSVYLKDYSLRNNFTFSLPIVEMTTSNSFIKLESILNTGDKNNFDISIVSAFVLPIDNKQKLLKIFSNHRNNDNIRFHILLEKKILSINEILALAQNTEKIRKLIPSYTDVKSLLKDLKI